MPKLLKILTSAATLIILFFHFSSFSSQFAYADFKSAYQDYTYTYQLYRTALNEFQIAKSSFLTYRTLTAQNEALDKFRKALVSRNQVIIVYYNLLQEKMNETPGVSPESKNTFNNIKESEKNWIDSHKQKIEAAGSFEDLNNVSSEFESRFPQMDTETKQAIGTIEMAKVADLKAKLNTQIDTLNTWIAQIGSTGQDTSFANRGIISARSKLDLHDQKINAALITFYPEKTSKKDRINLYNGQRQLTEAKQYLSETATYLLEIIKSFTG